MVVSQEFSASRLITSTADNSSDRQSDCEPYTITDQGNEATTKLHLLNGGSSDPPPILTRQDNAPDTGSSDPPPVLTCQDYAAGIPALDDLLDINESYAFEEPNSSQSQNESTDEDNDTDCPDILQPVKTPENPQRNSEPTDRQDRTNRPDILQRVISEAELNNELQNH